MAKLNIPQGIIDLLLTYKTMREGQFALFRKNINNSGFCYYQINRTTAVPNSIWKFPKEGVLLDFDIDKNLELVSVVAKLTDQDIFYCYPNETGFKVLVISYRGETLFDGELKIISKSGLKVWLALKFIKFKLWKSKNKLYKMF